MLDVAEGLKDIRREKIRVLHERSFIDDPTRILRAVRFEQRLGFQIEPKSLSLLKTALRKKMVDYVKPPRYFEEFKKILKETDPAKHLKRLHSLGGLDFLSGRFLWTAATARFLAKIEKESGRFQENFPDKNFEPWIVNFAALISSLRPVDCEKICRRFQLSNTQRKTVLSSGKVTEVIKKLSLRNQPASEIYRLLRPLSYETMVFLKVKASGAVVQQRVNRFLKKHDHIALHIDGFDVQKAGVPKGSKIGVVLKNVLYAKIDGRVWTKRDELRLAKELSVSLS
jgi:tRNA nucleotidyltransferase (CCA-adding enzyme)